MLTTAEPSAGGGRRYGRIGKYDVLAHVATGGMCVVYKARDADLGREVALKILPPELAARPVLLERFRREARHVARLRHENIVSIYECGEAGGMNFLALEFVDGIDLHEYVVRKGPLDPDEARLILTQAARALDQLHNFHMVHRDIKPANFVLAQQTDPLLVKLTDLGLARVTCEEEFRVTRAGYTVGTIDYMAPEQARDSGLADIRSDLYSLGCTGFYMLTGQPPFAEGGLTERLYKHLCVEPLDVRQHNPRIAADLAGVVRKLLAKRPAERHQTPAELLRDLAGLGRSAAATATRPAAAANRLPAAHTLHGGHGRDTTGDVDLGEAGAEAAALTSPEQRQAAAGQFARAREVLETDNYDYAIHLLLTCCKLDPNNLTYRRALRRATQARDKGGRKKGRFSFLSTSKAKAKLKAAKAARDYLKVLEYGEEVLALNSQDVGAQKDMAEAAEALGRLELAVWLLEQAWRKDAPDVGVSRTLARLYERRGNYHQAVVHWEVVCKAEPGDVEASRKARDLAATETIARGQYEEGSEGR